MILNESIKPATPYMIRNDGKVFTCGVMHPYVATDIYRTPIDNILYLFNDDFKSLLWFYTNTAKVETKKAIEILVSAVILDFSSIFGLSQCNIDKIKNMINFDLVSAHITQEQMISLYVNLNSLCNQEFLRARTSNMLYGGSNNSIYFRISSVNFNWFDIIWDFVNKHKMFISDVTIVKDSRTFGGKYDIYKKFNHIPIGTFLTLSGNPIVENYTDIFKLINESMQCIYNDDFNSYVKHMLKLKNYESNYLKNII